MGLSILSSVVLMTVCALVTGESGGLYSPVDGIVELTPVDNNTGEAGLEALGPQVKKELGGAGDTSSDVQSICFDSDVIELQGEHFTKQVLNSDEIWLVEFYTPSCPHCKSLALEWIKVAAELKGRIKVGAIDASEYAQLAGEYRVRSYPTILYFPPKMRQPAHALEYRRSERSAAEIVEWANSLTLAQMPSVPLRQIISETSLSECGAKPWCMIVLLPTLHDCNARCRNQLLERLRSLGGKYRDQGWGWIWTEAGQQRPLEQSMRVSSYPSLAMVNCGQMKIGLFSAAFDEAGLDAYLDSVARGRAKLRSLSCAQLPPIRSVQPWNGLDARLQLEANSGEHVFADEL